jgi:hypothetical protein
LYFCNSAASTSTDASTSTAPTARLYQRPEGATYCIYMCVFSCVEPTKNNYFVGLVFTHNYQSPKTRFFGLL